MAPSVDGCLQQRALSCRINCTASVRASAAQAGFASPWVSASKSRIVIGCEHATPLGSRGGWFAGRCLAACLDAWMPACLSTLPWSMFRRRELYSRHSLVLCSSGRENGALEL